MTWVNDIGLVPITVLQMTPDTTTFQEDSSMEAFKIAQSVVGVLSSLGGIFNIIITLVLRPHHDILGKMVIILSVYDAIYSITYILFANGSLQSNFSSGFWFFTWTESLTWTICFAHALYVSVKGSLERLNSSLLKKYLIASAIVGVLVVVTEIVTVDIANFSLWYMGVLSILSVIVCTFCYLSLIKEIRNYVGRLHLELLLYPLILIVCDFPMVFLMIALSVAPTIISVHYARFVSLCLVSRGFLNSLVYGLSSKIRRGFKEFCWKKPQKPPAGWLLESEPIRQDTARVPDLISSSFIDYDNSPKNYIHVN